jgi:anti-sigma factor RsiW
MWCTSCRKQQIEYESGELSPGRRAAVARHLESCPRCREAYRQGERLRELLDPAPAEGTRHNLWTSVAARIADQQSAAGREPRPRPVLQRAWRPAAALAALAAAAAVTFTFLTAPRPATEAGAWVERAAPQEISRLVREDPWAGDVTRALDSALSDAES